MTRKLAFAIGLCTVATVPVIAQDFVPDQDVAAEQDVDLQMGDTAGPEATGFDMEPAGLFSHGYFRFGAGSTDGDPMVAFKLDGAATKYRLGNESDLYGEASLGYRAPLNNGSTFVGEVMLNGWANSNGIFFGEDWDDDGDVAQAYVGLESLGDGSMAEAFLWAGRRYYRRREVHMTDFFYEDLSGDAIGLENVMLGNVGLSAAAFYYDDSDVDYDSTALDVRVHDIDLGLGGWLGEVGMAYIDGNGEAQSGDDGYSLRFHLDNVDLDWGEMRNSLMYGAGAGIDFSSKGNQVATDNDYRWRFVNQTFIRSTEDLETQATFAWQRTDLDGIKETWLSAGVRPSYNFNHDWGAAVELGYDWVDADHEDSRSLTKVTFAPFYSFGKKGYFARPQLRAFATWANWSEEGAITEQAAYGSGTNGTTYGVQLEHWW